LKTGDQPCLQHRQALGILFPVWTGQHWFAIRELLITNKSTHEIEPDSLTPRYLLVKAYVGFGDRLQCLSHALNYASKFSRTICIDWTDAIWSDGTIGFETFFDLCNVPMILPGKFYPLEFSSVAPLAWSNQLDRQPESKFIYKDEYSCSLSDQDCDAKVLFFGSTGDRTFYQSNLSLLRVKRQFRDLIVSELKKFAMFHTVVHLRGTDRNGPEGHVAYLEKVVLNMAAISNDEPLLVVTDSLILFQLFHAKYPQAVLRTPHLDQFTDSHRTHFQSVASKRDFNLQMLIDFFLIIYAENCVLDGESLFLNMARFIRSGDCRDILGYDA